LDIPVKVVEEYKSLIKEKLEAGFWNEIVGEDIWFLFKHKDGSIKEYTLTNENREEIAHMCSRFNNDPIEKTTNLWLYLASNPWYTDVMVQEETGVMVNSDFLNGLDVHTATEKVMDYFEEKGWGKRVVSYHLRDWLISRQRYWGPPIPMIFCQSCADQGKSWFTTKESQMTNDKYQISKKDGIGDLRFEIGNSAQSAVGWKEACICITEGSGQCGW
jgi:hypothetical protein